MARLFVPVVVIALLVLAALQIPLAWRLARRVRDAQYDRQRFLELAIDASDQERRLIAGGLHDGVVQELAGHSFQMAAALEQDPPKAELRRVLSEGAAGTRTRSGSCDRCCSISTRPRWTTRDSLRHYRILRRR